MFGSNTVFVLGAGASREYGFPTAREMVDAIVTIVQDDITSGKHLQKFKELFGPDIQQTADEFVTHLRSQGLPIDLWLEQKGNQQYGPLGKYLIAKALMRGEEESNLLSFV